MSGEKFRKPTDAEPSMDEVANSCLIDLSVKLPPPPVAMNVNSGGKQITLFTKGNFSIITGKAKSRKSFLVSMLMASAIKSEFDGHFFCPRNEGMNILFDTEQAEYKVQQVSRRILSLSGKETSDNFHSYHLRRIDPDKRIEIIGNVLAKTKEINLVAIDGIIDLAIDPILQADQAQNIIQCLMRWSELYNCHIVCVLHYNKNQSTLIGHLGSFAHRKADSVIVVTKDVKSKDLSLVTCIDAREVEFEPFAFLVDEYGMPRINSDYMFSKSTTELRKKITPSDFELTQHTRILESVFKVSDELTYENFWRTIKSEYDNLIKSKLGDNVAKDFATFYYQEKMVIKVKKGQKTIYTLSGQKHLQI